MSASEFPVPAGATFTGTDCPQHQLVPGNPAEFVCNWGHQLRAGETATVLLVLLTPASASSMAAAGSWSIKEGVQNKGAA